MALDRHNYVEGCETMTSHAELGCEACRTASLRGMASPPLRELGHATGPVFLYQCAECSALWEENLREAHVITEAEALRTYPETVFKPPAT